MERGVTQWKPTSNESWYATDANDVVTAMASSADAGLTTREAQQRLNTVGPNEIASEESASIWKIALKQLRDPMNIMLVAVAIASFFIGQVPVGIVVTLLVLLNISIGARQERAAQASVDALSKLQIPSSRVVRDGALTEVPATQLVPGDIVQLEAGDLIPADGRLLRSATLETQEAALTGESASIEKSAGTIAAQNVQIGDRANMLFQNTSVTRGTATMVVTETGMNTQMGKIATMLSAVEPVPSPLQKELTQLTKLLGGLAWGAVAIIAIIGLARGNDFETVLLLGISMAISAIPTGMPTFVQMILSHGARQLADANAIVKNLSDVETLGTTSAINSDKTGTLTMNAMTVRTLIHASERYTVQGEGYAKQGAILSAAGVPAPDLTTLAYGLCLASDAVVGDDGTVLGDPTEAALVVLAAKVNVDAEETRRTYPRVAEVPFDSDYKFMATFHEVPLHGKVQLVELVKGAPDIILARCSHVLGHDGPMPVDDEMRQRMLGVNEELSQQGLRVLAFAYRTLEGQEDAVKADPMSFVSDLTLSGCVGILDPLRPEAVTAVRIAHQAGIDVRMITGDHAVTAAAIGAELDLGPGATSGSDIQAMTDEELLKALPNLHVFGRVTPEDKLRIVELMQKEGQIVAMTGDAVNDAAALKQADIGVAMGSGSEVTKQAARMILTDDNFDTLISAIRIGRGIYGKIVSYVRFQMASLISLVLLFLIAAAFNINQGVPLTPLMVLFQNFFIVSFPILMILKEPASANLMAQPPRDPKVPITNPTAIRIWLLGGITVALTTLAALYIGPGEMFVDEPNKPMTMAFVVMAIGLLLGGFSMRHDPDSGFTGSMTESLKILGLGVVITILSVETSLLQRLLITESLTGREWLISIGLAAIVMVVIEADKALRRRNA